jgi:hypothetical protein
MLADAHNDQKGRPRFRGFCLAPETIKAARNLKADCELMLFFLCSSLRD